MKARSGRGSAVDPDGEGGGDGGDRGAPDGGEHELAGDRLTRLEGQGVDVAERHVHVVDGDDRLGCIHSVSVRARVGVTLPIDDGQDDGQIAGKTNVTAG